MGWGREDLRSRNVGGREKREAADVVIRWTRRATENEKLKEWRRAYPRERMRVVIPPKYIIPVEHHIRDPYHDFDIEEIDTGCVREAILRSLVKRPHRAG
ncbi:hypothetical protein COCNU_scaffold003754G000010 [Cocos nucifera]|nr:hypothetical protein [Cocos nucifera]